MIDERISKAIRGSGNWVLIGGPPCQVYSIVGRSRGIPVDPEKYENDKRHFLYKAYLRIIAKNRPPVFVMENVRGILTAEVGGKPIIDRLLNDLQHPAPASKGQEGSPNGGLEYKIFPLAKYSDDLRLFDAESDTDPEDFIIRSEHHRIPQAGHRFILLGVRSDISARPGLLRTYRRAVAMWPVIRDLPRLRSRLSNEADSGEAWVDAIRELSGLKALCSGSMNDKVYAAVRSKPARLSPALPAGSGFTEWHRQPLFCRQPHYPCLKNSRAIMHHVNPKYRTETDVSGVNCTG